MSITRTQLAYYYKTANRGSVCIY